MAVAVTTAVTTRTHTTIMVVMKVVLTVITEAVQTQDMLNPKQMLFVQISIASVINLAVAMMIATAKNIITTMIAVTN